MIRTDNLFFRGFASLVAMFWVHAAFAADFGRLNEVTGQKLPEFTFRDESGIQLVPEVSQAKLSVFHFWATWCAPCLKEMPELNQVSGERPNLLVFPLSLDGMAKVPKIQEFYAVANLTNLAIFIDDNNAALRSINGIGLPVTIFVDQSGNIVARTEGPVDWKSKEVKDLLDKYLNQ